MAVDKGLFLVSREIAIRSGMVASRYRTTDGKFILNERDMSRVRPTSDEIIHGFDIEEITKAQALELARKNGYKMGLDEEAESVVAEQPLNDEYIGEEEPVAEENEEEQENEQVNEEEKEETNDEYSE